MLRKVLKTVGCAALLSTMLAAVPAQAQVTRIKTNPNAFILDGVRVAPGNEIYFLSASSPRPSIRPRPPRSKISAIPRPRPSAS
jgi:hypothetical protein